MLNFGTPAVTAFMRGLYLAGGTFAVAFLPAYAVTDSLKGPLISGGLGALFALGFRSGVEGVADSRRNDKGQVKPGDVGA